VQTQPGSGQHFDGSLTCAGIPLVLLVLWLKLKGFLKRMAFPFLAGATSDQSEQCQNCCQQASRAFSVIGVASLPPTGDTSRTEEGI